MANKRRTLPKTPARGSSPPSAEPTGAQIPVWLDRVRTRYDLGPAGSVRNIFLTRAFDAVVEMTDALPLKVLEESATASNNLLVLLKAFQSPEVLPELERYEPLASPYLRGLQAQQDLLRKAGGLIGSEEVAKNLNLSRQAVDKRRQSGKLIAIPQGQRSFGYPACQFNSKGPVPGLEQMLAALGPTDAWGQLTFLLSDNSALDNRSPLDLLNEGHIARVMQVACIFGEHGGL